jgi:Predicted ATP-dependent serine protease
MSESRTFDRNAKGVREILSTKFETFPFADEWYDAFGNPERRGVWFIWGNSGSGKTTFAMQLAKKLCEYERVALNSLEEGASLTMRNTLIRCGMMDVNKRFILLDRENLEQLSIRLKKQKSPGVVIIDSFQYTMMNYRDYISFKEQHRNKLLIFISHADGKMPNGRAAKSVMYDADLKIYVEGFRAFSKGRFIGPTEHYDIYKPKAQEYWGDR